MSATDSAFDGISEPCEYCGRETPHEVSVTLVVESTNPENAAYSREPYRVSECLVCGSRSKLRMNNA